RDARHRAPQAPEERREARGGGGTVNPSLPALVLLVSMALTILALARARNLYAVMILMGVYSGLIAVGFSLLGAVDVSFTEVVVGSSVSSILIMLLLKRVNTRVLRLTSRPTRALAAPAALGVGRVLVAGITGLAPFGSPDSPVNTHV